MAQRTRVKEAICVIDAACLVSVAFYRNAVAALVLLPASWIILILADQGIIKGDGWKWPVRIITLALSGPL